MLVIFVAALLAVAGWAFAGIPEDYKAEARFSLVFSKILYTSAAPARDIRELGLSASDLALIGQHAFIPSSPVSDPVWLADFSKRCTYAKVALFWLHHPWRTLGALRADLNREAWQRRPINLSNFQPDSGKPPGARTDRFGSWSAVSTGVSHLWPTHVVVAYALLLLLGFRSRGSAFSCAALRVACLAAVLGSGEFLIASLADALETSRHLLLFHLFTDYVIFLALVSCLGATGLRGSHIHRNYPAVEVKA